MIDSEFDRIIRGENNYKNPKKGKWKIILIIIILVIITGAAVYGYYSYSQYKAAMPKIKFFEYLNKTNIEQITDISLLKGIKSKIDENSYTLNNNISISTGNESDILSKINAEINHYKDIEKDINKTDFIINNNEDEVIKVSQLGDSENIAVKSDEIVVKYVGSKIENLNKLFNNSEVQESESYAEKITFPNKKILDTYKEILNSKLLEEQFKIEKNVKLTEENNSIETTLYSLSFDKQEILQIITELQDTLINDDEFINCLITGNVAEQSDEEYGISGITPSDALNLASGYKIDASVDKVKEEIENNFIKIFEELNSIENLKFNFDIYVSDNKVIKEVINLEKIFELNLDFKNISENENTVKATLLFENKETGEKDGYSLSLNRKNNNVTTNFKLEVNLIEKRQINNKIIFEVNLEGNSSSKNINSNITITYSDTENEYVLKVNSKLEYSLKEKIEKIDSDNCLFLDEFDQETRKAVIESIYTKAVEVIGTKYVNILNPVEEVDEQRNQIIDIDGETEEEIAQKKQAAQTKLINAVTAEMEKAQNEGREYALIDLQGLEIEDSVVSVMVNENLAIIAVDGYTFYIDPNFNLTEE